MSLLGARYLLRAAGSYSHRGLVPCANRYQPTYPAISAYSGFTAPIAARSHCSSPPAPAERRAASAVSNSKMEGNMHMVFTCTKCHTRSLKTFAKRSYKTGVVIVRCPGCMAQHLVADNLGWFGEEKNIEEVFAKQGIKVPVISEHDVEYIPEPKEAQGKEDGNGDEGEKQ